MTVHEKTLRLKEKLETLRTLDKEMKVFGAKGSKEGGHGYKSDPANEKEIIHIEEYLNIQLPEDYKDFLLTVGYGAGPGYGLLSLDRIMKDYPRWTEDEEGLEDQWHDEEELNTETGYGIIKSLDDLKLSHIELFKERTQKIQPKYLAQTAPYVLSCNGGIMITYDGCSYGHLLIVEGELAGTVWDAEVKPCTRIIPEGLIKDKQGEQFIFRDRVFTFSEWIEDWVDQSIQMFTQ